MDNNEKNEQNKESTKEKTAKFAVSLAKIMGGIGTKRDWIIVLKYGIPIALGGAIFALGLFAVLITIIFGAVDMVQNALKNAGESTANFFEKLGNWFSGYGFNDSETAYINLVTKNKDLGCKKSSIVTETIMYYYQNNNDEFDFGSEDEEDEGEIEQTTTDPETGETKTETVTGEINYGKVLPDLKRLSKKIRKGEDEYEKYVKDTFLEKEPYNKLLDGYDDIEKRKDEIYEDIVGIAEAIPCSDAPNLAGGVCTYNTKSAQNVSNLKVRLLNCNAPYDPVSDEELVDFEKYITGVVYQEVGGYSYEVKKAQAIAARSYALLRNEHVGAGIGKIYQENGQWIIDLRACTFEQAYCDPDKGCWSVNEGGEGNLGPDGTIHSGEAPSSGYWGQPPLPEDSDIRKAVKETTGMVAIDKDGNITYTDFDNTVQDKWESMVSQGMDYQEVLKNYYDNVESFSSNCQYSATGQIRLPLDEGTYSVTSGFGGRSSPGGIGSTNHKGIDLGAPMGTPIYAVAPGIVIDVTSGFGGGYGNSVTISHDIKGDGSEMAFTMYAHQSEVLVKKGDVVSGGQIIGKVGSTGNSTGPHLHFEIRRGGTDFYSSTPEDPEILFESIKAGTSIFNEMIKSREKYYNQADYANVEYCPGMSNASMQSSGCLPTAMAMVVSYLKDSSVTPPDVANNICTNYKDYRVENGGTVADILSNSSFLSGYHLSSTHVTSDYENKIKEALKAHKAIIVNVKGGTFNPSGQGHFFVVVNSGNDNTVKVLDPGERSRTKEYKISDFVNNIYTGIWIFS